MVLTNVLASFTSERIGEYATLLSAVLQIVSLATVQGLEGYIGDMELNATRFTAQTILTSLALSLLKLSPVVERKQIGWIVGVCVLFFGFNYFYYAAAPLLPVGIITGIEATVLMIFGIFYHCVITRSINFKLSEGLALVVCLIGVVLATQPTFLGFAPERKVNVSRHKPICAEMNKPVKTTQHPVVDQAYLTNGTIHTFPPIGEGQVWGMDASARGYMLVAFFCLFTFAGQVVLNNRIPNINFLIISFWISLFSSLTSYAMTFIFETPILPMGAGCWGLFFGHNVSLAAASCLTIYALQRTRPFVYALLTSTSLFIFAILQYTILSHIQPGHRNWYGILGVVLIIVGNVVRPLGDIWSARRKPDPLATNTANHVKYSRLKTADPTATG